MSNSFAEIQHLYQKLRMLIFCMLLLLIAALAMAFVNHSLILPFLAVAVICHLFFVRPCQNQYTSAVSAENLRRTLCKSLGNDEILEKGGQRITVKTLTDAGLMPCGDEKNVPLFRWEIHGEKKGLSLALCDATIPQCFKLADKGKKRVHFNAGVWVHMDLPTDTQKHFKLLDETSVPTPIRMDYFSSRWNFETASVSDTDIGKRFVLYRPKDTEQGPSPALLRRLKSLMEYTPGYVALSIRGSQLDIFVRGRFLTRPVSISRKPSQELLDFDPFPELAYIMDLAASMLH